MRSRLECIEFSLFVVPRRGMDTDWHAVDLMLDLAAKHQLTARRVHDARHAATALAAGVTRVYTYDSNDWQVFAEDGIEVVGPPSAIGLV